MDTGSNPTSTVHFLPCSIDYNGSAPVKSFFQIQPECDGSLTSHLRGRKLKGVISQLETSDSKTAATSETSNESRCEETLIGLHLTDNGDRKWVVDGHFSTISVWEHDNLSDTSRLDDCLSWITIANHVSLFTLI
jgi:Ribonuclease H2 non-catalytic subunit (Ylr154p-like)